MSTLMRLAGDMPELADAIAWFTTFTASYRTPECDALELKIRHTCAVTRTAAPIVDSLHLPPSTRRAALLAALLHDVGRFPQFAQWQTFRDADSVNHGTLGARILARHRESLAGESPEIRRQVIGAVALHNRYSLPECVREPLSIITHIVRDADKIDILRIFSRELQQPEPSGDVVLHVAREPEKWSPHIVDMLLRQQMPDYRDLRYVNDFVMLLCFWPGTLQFAASRNMVRQEGTLESLLEVLPQHDALRSVRDLVRQMAAAEGSSKP